MNEPVFRHELKFTVSLTDCLVIRQRLRAVAQTDPHVDESGKYRIRSLYFDTPDDNALREKLYGVSMREKFRIRMYNDDNSFIKLEKKAKVGGVGNKRSASLSPEQCEAIIAGDIEWMKDSGNPLLVEFYGKWKGTLLRPKTIVEYTREPFLYRPGNVRITLDSDIRTGIRSLDFLNPDLPLIRTHAVPVTIMEVKYDDFFPAVIRDAIQLGNRKSSVFSKYAVSRMYG